METCQGWRFSLMGRSQFSSHFGMNIKWDVESYRWKKIRLYEAVRQNKIDSDPLRVVRTRTDPIIIWKTKWRRKQARFSKLWISVHIFDVFWSFLEERSAKYCLLLILCTLFIHSLNFYIIFAWVLYWKDLFCFVYNFSTGVVLIPCAWFKIVLRQPTKRHQVCLVMY